MQGWVALVDMPKMEWKESVNLVFDYFCERTPRSFVEARDTSVVWNYKYAGELHITLTKIFSLSPYQHER